MSTYGKSGGPSTIIESSLHDDLRFTVRAIKSGDGAQAIFSLCRALGDGTEAAEIVLSEWRK